MWHAYKKRPAHDNVVQQKQVKEDGRFGAKIEKWTEIEMRVARSTRCVCLI